MRGGMFEGSAPKGQNVFRAVCHHSSPTLTHPFLLPSSHSPYSNVALPIFYNLTKPIHHLALPCPVGTVDPDQKATCLECVAAFVQETGMTASLMIA